MQQDSGWAGVRPPRCQLTREVWDWGQRRPETGTRNGFPARESTRLRRRRAEACERLVSSGG